MGFRVDQNSEVIAEKRLLIEENAVFTKTKPKLDRKELLLSLSKLALVRWETLCFIKSGAMKGVDSGTLTVACLEQTETAEKLIASVIGNDAGILDPGRYSKENFENICEFIHSIYFL